MTSILPSWKKLLAKIVFQIKDLIGPKSFPDFLMASDYRIPFQLKKNTIDHMKVLGG